MIPRQDQEGVKWGATPPSGHQGGGWDRSRKEDWSLGTSQEIQLLLPTWSSYTFGELGFYWY